MVTHQQLAVQVPRQTEIALSRRFRLLRAAGDRIIDGVDFRNLEFFIGKDKCVHVEAAYRVRATMLVPTVDLLLRCAHHHLTER